ncbi:putative yap-binding protein [Erysiphe neolycopersici]|uniref:Putative yap-binding protein n=1 Tax=Erysiphe neolycopersici TaxID=212602 RepID=A0A420I4M8_9PEZI|nr:putative yap-binding protein [Erysiphe neolycopersici]
MASFLLECLPPKCDYITYLTIIESHLSPEILPTLNEILQDQELTQNIGWDLIHLLLPIPNSVPCLTTIAKYGNPREVILKATEALQQLVQLDSEQGKVEEKTAIGPTSDEKFCTLINLLSILHPRIKTKHPSRFLSTTLESILATYRPSDSATVAVISFLHAISGDKKLSLIDRFSTVNLHTSSKDEESLAPDPEAQDEDAQEEELQIKLLKSFITHIIEQYVAENPLDWAARLFEHFHPEKVIEGRSLGKSFREDPILQAREKTFSQLVDVCRNLGLMQYNTLFAIFTAKDILLAEQNYPGYDSYSEEIPPSRVGSLLLAAYSIFYSILFKSQVSLPQLTIFPHHAKMVKIYVRFQGPDLIEGSLLGIIDAILLIGLWLESENKFVAGPLEDEEFLEHLQWLSYLSLKTPSPSLRYVAHMLSSSILHAHPVDRLRLTFIKDTLENCPYETLKASAVSWLKEELITAHERNSNGVFASPAALAATQPFIFPSTSGMLEADNNELVEEINASYPFHMAVLNFFVFLSGNKYLKFLPTRMLNVAEELYIRPLKTACERLLDLESKNPKPDFDGTQVELQLLEERLNLCLAGISNLNKSKDEI